MNNNSKSSDQIASVELVESVEESVKRQKINHVKQIIKDNLNAYINNPNLQTPNDIDDFANYLVNNTTFFVSTRPGELKKKIDFYLPGYNKPIGGSKKSKKYRKKSKKSKKYKKSRNKRR